MLKKMMKSLNPQYRPTLPLLLPGPAQSSRSARPPPLVLPAVPCLPGPERQRLRPVVFPALPVAAPRAVRGEAARASDRRCSPEPCHHEHSMALSSTAPVRCLGPPPSPVQLRWNRPMPHRPTAPPGARTCAGHEHSRPRDAPARACGARRSPFLSQLHFLSPSAAANLLSLISFTEAWQEQH